MPEIVKTVISVKMYALADKGHPRADELRQKARAFDEATHGLMSVHPATHTVKQMVGCWDRAARVFDECNSAEW